jgi:hypothetical protein
MTRGLLGFVVAAMTLALAPAPVAGDEKPEPEGHAAPAESAKPAWPVPVQELPPEQRPPPESFWERFHPRPTYVGLVLRPVVCASGACPDRFVFTFGFEAGFRCFGIGARYGYTGDAHYIVPDLRGYWEFLLTDSVVLMPLLEFSPALVKTDAGYTLELMFRPGLRLSWEVAKGWMLFVEPVSFDLAFFERVHDSFKGTTTTEVGFHSRYTPAIGVQMRF